MTVQLVSFSVPQPLEVSLAVRGLVVSSERVITLWRQGALCWMFDIGIR